MKKMKKWMALLAALCVAVSFSVVSVACGGNNDSSMDEGSNGSEFTENSTEEDVFESDPEDTRLFLTVSIRVDGGGSLSGVTFRVTSGSETVEMMTTDEDGRATCRLEKGTYTVRIADGLPSRHYPTFYSQEVELTENITIAFTVMNDELEEPSEDL